MNLKATGADQDTKDIRYVAVLELITCGEISLMSEKKKKKFRINQTYFKK